MKRERWRTVFFLVILLVVTLFVRLFFLQSNLSFITIEGDCYQKALIGKYGIYKLQNFGLDEIYTKALSVSMLIFGNYKIAGVYLNIILQVLAIVLIYFAIVFIANDYAAILVALAVSVIPFYSDKSYEISTFHLLVLLYAVGLFILVVISKGVYMFAIKKKSDEQVDTDMKNDMQEEKTGVITLDDIIKDNNSSREDSQLDKVMQTEETINTEDESDMVPPGMKEIILDEEEKKKKVKFIENPLPVPKRREHKEMDFAVELRDNNDDYDIKDISDMDFFDIE